ncbi:MAG: CpsD/CapB family tyrosine-protein kinase [Gammaproteobacteria bacterium]
MEQLMRSLETPRKQHGTGPDVTRMRIDRHPPARNSIHYLHAQPVSLDKAMLRQNRVLTGREPAIFRESYQLLRTQILQRLKENHWNALGVTSPCAGEGKTLTAINLAISLAREIDYTIVLVDVNLRHPYLLECLGLPEQRGLGDYLTQDILIEELLIQPSCFEDLVILPGGQAQENSAELLNSAKVARFVSDMKSFTDKCITIFDMPPVLGTSETLAFSPQVDAALLVIEDGITKREDVANTMDLLGATNIVGTVLNKAGIVDP